VLLYSTYLGGSGNEEAWGIAVDTAGDAYVTGTTSSTNFPTTTGAFQTAFGAGAAHIFVTKLNATGSARLYSTYLGGSSGEGGAPGIAVDSLGNAYVTGGTASSNFPTTTGAYQTIFGGGTDAFVTKLNASGSALVYSTFLGGSGGEGGFFRIALDTLGNAYVVGHTSSTNFPTTVGAFQTALIGNVSAYVTKLNATGSALLYSTYLGGSTTQIGGGPFKEGIAVAVDTLGNAHVAGATTSSAFPTTPLAFQTMFGGGLADAFVTKLNATGSALLYSTYLGGSGYDAAFGIALDTVGNAYVTGDTGSINFPSSPTAFQPALNGNSDAFVTKLNATGSALLYSTHLGGSGDEGGRGIALDTAGNAHVAGSTTSSDFPTTAAAAQTAFGHGLSDAFVTKLNATGSGPLLYSTYLGGSANDDGTAIALDSLGAAYVAGVTTSTNFPTTTGAFQTVAGGAEDAFVAKLGEVIVPPPPPPPPASIGKVTGHGSIKVAGGIASFEFVVKHRAKDGSTIRGKLLYVNRASGTKVRSVKFTTFVITGNMATFGGTCTRNGAPCTFTVNVTDNGPRGKNDSFNITVDAGPTEGAGEKLRSGNITIHRQQQREADDDD
jgi:hypothetical protein